MGKCVEILQDAARETSCEHMRLFKHAITRNLFLPAQWTSHFEPAFQEKPAIIFGNRCLTELQPWVVHEIIYIQGSVPFKAFCIPTMIPTSLPKHSSCMCSAASLHALHTLPVRPAWQVHTGGTHTSVLNTETQCTPLVEKCISNQIRVFLHEYTSSSPKRTSR